MAIMCYHLGVALVRGLEGVGGGGGVLGMGMGQGTEEEERDVDEEVKKIRLERPKL